MKEIIDILRQLRPATCEEVTLPFTPPCNGLLVARLRASDNGRMYEYFSNATPSGVESYQVGDGYFTGMTFVTQGDTVSVTARTNVKSNEQRYWFIPMKIGGGYCITSILCAISSLVRRWSYENSMELTGEVADHISCCKRRIKIHQDREDRHLLGESTNKQQRLMHRRSSVDVSKYHGDVYNRHCIIWRESSICRSNGINTSRRHTGLYQSLYKVRYVISCKLLRWLACNRFAVALEGGCC